MRNSEGRRVAVAAAVVGAAVGVVAIAIKVQRDSEINEWADKLRDAVTRADGLTNRDVFGEIAAASDAGQAILTPAEGAHFSAVGLQDPAVRTVREVREQFLDAPRDKNTMAKMAKALAAVSRQGQSGMNYANAIVEALAGQIAERKLHRPPYGL